MNLELPDSPLLGADEQWPAEGWGLLGVTVHPVAPLPDEAWLRAHPLAALLEYLNEREETIRRMAENPLEYGWEPATWKILDALCGFPWAEDTAEKRAWALKVRQALLKQDEAIRVLLLNGGNRGSKSEWAASRVMKLLLWKARARSWCFHQDATMSVEYQQPLLYKYLPAELRTEKGIKKNPTYIAYKQQTGFSDDRFVLHNASECSLRNYEQKFEKIQGGELDIIWCDELVPSTWVKELKARIATRGGWLIITFTPISGYSPTVKMFLDKAQPTFTSTAFLLPKDGGAPELELALQGEDAMAWIDGGRAQPEAPAGREFEEVPRVMRTVGDKRVGIFFFHSFDNPFGNPRELYALYQADTTAGKKMRFYGVATKAMSGRFPKFDPTPGVHVIRPDQVPKRGTRYHVVDPCSGRNWAQIWAIVERCVSGKRITIYREWPCPGKYVPGVGDMGYWAEPGDKLDGEQGPAQQPLGWGLLRYADETDRLEGRKRDEDVGKPRPPTKFDEWDTEDPQPVAPRRRHRPEEGEDIYERIMDSRYAVLPSQTREGQTTLLEQCGEVGLNFVPASGKDIDEGIDLINDLLDYDADEDMGPMNEPRLRVSEDCVNLIFALQNWTGADGQDGACKDFVDLVRYLLLHDPEDWSDREERKERDAA